MLVIRIVRYRCRLFVYVSFVLSEMVLIMVFFLYFLCVLLIDWIGLDRLVVWCVVIGIVCCEKYDGI